MDARSVNGYTQRELNDVSREKRAVPPSKQACRPKIFTAQVPPSNKAGRRCCQQRRRQQHRPASSCTPAKQLVRNISKTISFSPFSPATAAPTSAKAHKKLEKEYPALQQIATSFQWHCVGEKRGKIVGDEQKKARERERERERERASE